MMMMKRQAKGTRWDGSDDPRAVASANGLALLPIMRIPAT
jgi:hypothetical protein